jgi:hypothetical protein
MMRDQFANYVVQKLLDVCDDAQRERLLTSVRAHLHSVKKFTYGKHIVARVEKFQPGDPKTLETRLGSLALRRGDAEKGDGGVPASVPAT